MTAFDWANLLTGRQNPYDELRDYEKRTALANATALSPDAAQGGVSPGVGPPGPPMGAPPGQPGGPAPAGGAPGPAPITTPDTTPPGQPQSYSTPKDLGSILVDLQQYNQDRAGFDKALGGFASVFAQPINRDRVMQSFEDAPAPDAENFAKSLLELNTGQQNQDRLNALGRAINGPQGAALAQKLGITQQQLQAKYLANPIEIGRMIESYAAPTATSKDFATAQAAIEKQVRQEHPDWTDAQVQAEVNRQAPPSMLLSGIGDLGDQAYRQYVATERAAGRTPLDPIAWKEHTQITTREKESAINEYPSINQKLTINEGYVNQLLADPDAALTALTTPWPTTGVKGHWDPMVSQKVKDAAIIIDQLRSSLTGAALSDVRNVRNVREFNALGQAATGGLNAAHDKQGLIDALTALKTKFATTRSIAQQQAGMPAEEAPPAPKEEPKIPKYNPKTGEFE